MGQKKLNLKAMLGKTVQAMKNNKLITGKVVMQDGKFIYVDWPSEYVYSVRERPDAVSIVGD